MAEEIKIDIAVNGDQGESALKGTAAGVAGVGATAGAPAVGTLAGMIDTLRMSLRTASLETCIMGSG